MVPLTETWEKVTTAEVCRPRLVDTRQTFFTYRLQSFWSTPKIKTSDWFWFLERVFRFESPELLKTSEMLTFKLESASLSSSFMVLTRRITTSGDENDLRMRITIQPGTCQQCAVPGNIHTQHKEAPGNSEGVGEKEIVKLN